MGMTSSAPYKKSARIAGEVMVNITHTVTHLFMMQW